MVPEGESTVKGRDGSRQLEQATGAGSWSGQLEQTAGAGSWSRQLSGHISNHKQQAERTGSGQACEPFRTYLRGTLPRQRLDHFPKQQHQPGTKCSSTRAHGGHCSLKPLQVAGVVNLGVISPACYPRFYF